MHLGEREDARVVADTKHDRAEVLVHAAEARLLGVRVRVRLRVRVRVGVGVGVGVGARSGLGLGFGFGVGFGLGSASTRQGTLLACSCGIAPRPKMGSR